MAFADQPTKYFMGDHLSVKMFGAMGDGVTDDTAAILNALNWISAPTHPHSLWFPSGKYLTSSLLTLRLPASNAEQNVTGIRIYGDGPSSEIYNTGATNGALTVVGTGGFNFDDFFIDNIRIHNNTSGVADFGLHLQGLNGFGTHNIIVEGVGTSTIDQSVNKTLRGIWLDGCEMGTLIQTHIRLCNRGFSFTALDSFPGSGTCTALQLMGGMVQSCTGADGDLLRDHQLRCNSDHWISHGRE